MNSTNSRLTCLDCKSFAYEPAYYGYYPGEHTPIQIGCGKQLWHLAEDEDDQDRFESYMRMASTCAQFEEKAIATDSQPHPAERDDLLEALRLAADALYNPFEPDNQSRTYNEVRAAIARTQPQPVR